MGQFQEKWGQALVSRKLGFSSSLETSACPHSSWVDRHQVGLLALLLLLSLVPRLYHLNGPFLDHWWGRDLLDHAVARHYAERGINLLWPEADFTPDQPNYVGIELPAIQALTALGWRAFGMQAWVPRAIAIVFSLVSIVALFLLLRHFLSAEGAFVATAFFALSPLNAFISRKFMNDPLTLCFSLLFMLLFVKWVNEGRGAYLVGAAVAGALAGLTKPPMIHVALPLAWYLWQRKGAAGLRDVRPYLCAAAVLVPTVFWMKHLATIRAQYFGVATHLESGMWGSWALISSPSIWALFIDRFTKEILTPVGIAGTLVGLGLVRRGRREWFLVVWLLAVVIYFFVLLGGNARQTYYQVWFLPPCAGLLGFAWEQLRQHLPGARRLAPALGVAFLVWAGWGLQSMFEIQGAVLRAAKALDQVDPARSWVIVYPAAYDCMVYLNRQGWCGQDVKYPHPWEAPGNPQYIVDRVRRGARFCVIFTENARAAPRDRVVEDWLARETPRVYHDLEFDIYRLSLGRSAEQPALERPVRRLKQ